MKFARCGRVAEWSTTHPRQRVCWGVDSHGRSPCYVGGNAPVLDDAQLRPVKANLREQVMPELKPAGEVCTMWKGGRVVECTGLENRQRRKSLVGSNPTPSANQNSLFDGDILIGDARLRAKSLVPQCVPLAGDVWEGVPSTRALFTIRNSFSMRPDFVAGNPSRGCSSLNT